MVSNLGAVKSLNYGGNGITQLMKLSNTTDGYLAVSLTIDKKRKSYLCHRLVAQAFLDNPLNLPCVNHMDENKTNNNINNLEYCTNHYNCLYGTNISRTSKTQSIPVIGVDILTNEIIRFASMHLAYTNGFDDGNICRCCKGKNKTYKGYKWFYEADYYELNDYK